VARRNRKAGQCRFGNTVRAVESDRWVSEAAHRLNETLESRIADREHEFAGNFARLAEIERENVVPEERKLIMREIHDGLGSKLFTSLSRVERGAMDAAQMATSLRACISDALRLAGLREVPGRSCAEGLTVCNTPLCSQQG
jgi:signal transduction histidine kinase